VLNVSAKDLGTGKEMSIRIEAATKLNDTDKDRMVREAEQYAEADKQLKEEIETRNQADTLVYSTEKMLGELGDKIPADIKGKIQGSLEELKSSLKDGSIPDIKTKIDELQKVSQEAGEAIYRQSAEAQQAAGGAQTPPPGDEQQEQGKKTVDADYRVVDDEEEKE
jgi:molecular chaperone DnaK